MQKKTFSPLNARLVRVGRLFSTEAAGSDSRKQKSLIEADGGRCDSYTLSSSSSSTLHVSIMGSECQVALNRYDSFDFFDDAAWLELT